MSRLLVPSLLLLAACGGATGAVAPPDSLVGDWAGGFYVNGPQHNPIFTVTLTIADDDGSAFTGGFVTASGEEMAGDLEGTRSGGEVEFYLEGENDNGDAVNFFASGTATGSTMQGTWQSEKGSEGSFVVELSE